MNKKIFLISITVLFALYGRSYGMGIDALNVCTDTIISSKDNPNRVQRVKPKLSEVQYQRVNNKEEMVFVPKGQWIFGGTISYTEHNNDNYKFIIIEKWNGSGYNISPSLMVGYAFKKNNIAGLRFTYNRSLLEINSLDININEDLNFGVDNFYSLRQTFGGTIFLRTYLPLFNSRRFGLFNDTQISIGGGRGKLINGEGEALKGTYETIKNFQIGVAPGLTAFVTDNVAIEVAVDVLGFKSEWVTQVTNQVDVGTRNTNSGKFKINLFSIKLGLSLYFNNKRFDK